MLTTAVELRDPIGVWRRRLPKQYDRDALYINDADWGSSC